jgi:hypothetical protein
LREEAFLVHKILEELKTTLEIINTPSSMTPTLNDTIKEFAKTMNEMENRVEVKPGEIMKRFKWPFTEKENEEYLSRLERYKNTFTLALNTIQRYIFSPHFQTVLICPFSRPSQRVEEGVRRVDYRTQDLHQIGLGNLFLSIESDGCV